MRQEYEHYTAENHGTWNLLFDRQVDNLQNKACTDYLLCLQEMQSSLHGQQVPVFKDLDRQLWKATGWTIEVVPGLIPVTDFFELLARRRFCSSTWIRRRDQLDYLEEPDMFHDIFGHVPLLMHPTYADFMQQIGALGVKYAGNRDIEDQLERLYWFTIEFGLLRERGQHRIYGAGILSSYGEAKHVFDPAVEVRLFDIEEIMHMEFRKDEIQSKYYLVKSFKELFASLDTIEDRFASPARA